MNLTIRGLDLAKAGFSLHGIAERGQVILQGRLSRPRRRRWLANLPPGRVGLEAGGGAPDGARTIQKLGHAVKLINSQFVRFCGVNCFLGDVTKLLM